MKRMPLPQIWQLMWQAAATSGAWGIFDNCNFLHHKSFKKALKRSDFEPGWRSQELFLWWYKPTQVSQESPCLCAQYFGSDCSSSFVSWCVWTAVASAGGTAVFVVESPESLSCYQVDTLYLVIQCQSIAKNSCLLLCSSEQRKGAHTSEPPHLCLLPSPSQIPRVNSLSSLSNGFLTWKVSQRHWEIPRPSMEIMDTVEL